MTTRRLFPLALLALSLAVGCGKSRSADRAEPPAAAFAAAPTAPPPTAPASDAPAKDLGARKALLEIHASIELTVDKEARAVSLAGVLDDFARGRGGYLADSQIGATPGVTHLVLRVPPAELPALRGVLAGEGTLTKSTETATDVTDAIADLDARVRSARVEEARLLKLLEEKSGSISDVLAAERALADVRQRIERLESEQRVAQGRVDLATVDVTIHHPVAVAAGAEPATLERLSDAAKDGVDGAKSVVLGIALVGLRAGPTLLFFSAIASVIALAVRRARRQARAS